jgi:CxxC-x17-CxxC domain-containing protein
MRNYNRDRRSSRRDFGGRDSGRSEMHDAVCDECGKKCKVPFKPTGGKPIFCSSCFERQSGGRSGRRDSGRRDSRKRDYQETRMYTATCDECGKECEVPFRPTSGKPVFCNDCFKGKGGSSRERGRGRGDRSQQDQTDVINSKLDRIIQLLESAIIVEEEPKKKSAGKKKKVNKTAKKKTKAKKAVKRKAKKTTKKKTKAKKVASKKK